MNVRLAESLRKYPLTLQLLVLYVFFLPLLSVQIPSAVAGMSINPARLMVTAAIGLAIAGACIRPSGDQYRTIASNPALRMWVVFLLFSVAYYYILLAFDAGLPFGDQESFFRSWRGRPLGQLVAFLTYGVAPYLLVRRYAMNAGHRTLLLSALGAAVLVLVWYGYFQQITYRMGLPVTGRLLYEGGGDEMRLATYSVAGIDMLRFNSLGGEPREYGSFAIGGLLFYMAWRRASGTRPSRLVVLALGAAILLTLSTSAFLALAVFAVAAILDAMRQGFVSARSVLRVAVPVLVVAAIVVATKADEVLGERTRQYIVAAATIGSNTREYAAILQAQAPDLGALFYVMDLPQQPLHRLLFGFGLGNSPSGLGEIVLRYFDYDILREGSLEDSRSFLIKMIVETGLVGVSLLGLVFFRTLRNSRRLIDAAAAPGDRARHMAMRYAYLAFFIAGMIQISFYHFIVMGLIDAEHAVLRSTGRLEPSGTG